MSDLKPVATYICTLIRPFYRTILFMLLVALVWATDLSLRPYLLKTILNRLAGGKAAEVFKDLFMPALLYVLSYTSLTTVFRLYGYFVQVKMIPNLREKIASDAFNRLLAQSHNYYQQHFSGSLANKINDLISSIPELIQIIIDRFFSHTLAFLFAIFTLSRVQPIFALAMASWAFLFSIVAILFAKRLSREADAWSECNSLFTGNVVDTLSNMLSIRLFAAKRSEKQHLKTLCTQAILAEQKLQWSYFGMWAIYGYSALLLQIINFYFLFKGRQAGWITVGDFALVLVLNISISEFLWQIGKDFTEFTKLYGRITQALRLILAPSEINDQPEARKLQISAGKISFHGVKFNYPQTSPLFEDKSLTIPGGQKVGLVGYSGSGKSTFVHLILRLYEVTNGHILVDEQDIRKVTQESLLEQIAVIPQEPILFHRSLLENIRYGKQGATLEEVIAAAKQAHAHEFISKLPLGYDSLVGERGVKLSGGQRQRIAIARAILKNAPILILDEATSQLDSVTESLIQESLWQLMHKKTTIIIAHRLSTLLHMDRLLVFHKGKIVEDGTHQQLLRHGGYYQRLWNAQIGGFLPEVEVPETHDPARLLGANA